MVAQPLRLGGLALACALATAALVLLTVVASNLVLSVVTGLGVGTAAGTAPEPPAAAVLLAAETGQGDDRLERRCRDLRRAEVRGPKELLERCGERRGEAAERRP